MFKWRDKNDNQRKKAEDKVWRIQFNIRRAEYPLCQALLHGVYETNESLAREQASAYSNNIQLRC